MTVQSISRKPMRTRVERGEIQVFPLGMGTPVATLREAALRASTSRETLTPVAVRAGVSPLQRCRRSYVATATLRPTHTASEYDAPKGAVKDMLRS